MDGFSRAYSCVVLNTAAYSPSSICYFFSLDILPISLCLSLHVFVHGVYEWYKGATTCILTLCWKFIHSSIDPDHMRTSKCFNGQTRRTKKKIHTERTTKIARGQSKLLLRGCGTGAQVAGGKTLVAIEKYSNVCFVRKTHKHTHTQAN